ncbi:MAG: hypothetical protein ACLUEK_16585, partial [Oscillospiraceae bacterium]
MLHTVEHHGADGHLTGIGFAPRLSGDEPRQQCELVVRRTRGLALTALGYAQGLHRRGAYLAVHGTAVFT